MLYSSRRKSFVLQSFQKISLQQLKNLLKNHLKSLLNFHIYLNTPTPLLLIFYMTTFSTMFNKTSIFRVRVDTFWDQRCGQDRLGGRALRLAQDRGPSAAARTGSGAWGCGNMVNYIHFLHKRFMYKIDRRRAGSKNRILGN